MPMAETDNIERRATMALAFGVALAIFPGIMFWTLWPLDEQWLPLGDALGFTALYYLLLVALTGLCYAGLHYLPRIEVNVQ